MFMLHRVPKLKRASLHSINSLVFIISRNVFLLGRVWIYMCSLSHLNMQLQELRCSRNDRIKLNLPTTFIVIFLFVVYWLQALTGNFSYYQVWTIIFSYQRRFPCLQVKRHFTSSLSNRPCVSCLILYLDCSLHIKRQKSLLCTWVRASWI